MLTVETLRQNKGLAGLTDEQLGVIATMSQNDEAAVIGTKIGELHGRYDGDVLAVTGVKKKDGEKSYDYMKRVLGDYKTAADGASERETALRGEIGGLKKQMAEGGDEGLRKQLSDSQDRVGQLQKQKEDSDRSHASELKKMRNEMKGIHVSYAFDTALASVKVKEGTPDSVKRIVFESAKKEVLAKGTPDFVDENGTQRLVFRDSKGTVMLNPANGMKACTASELLAQTSLRDIVDTGKRQTGGGTGREGGNGGGAGAVDLSSVKTQTEADEAIAACLLAQGVTRYSPEFSDRMAEIRKDNNVSDLPLQ